MSYNPKANYRIAYSQQAKIQKQLRKYSLRHGKSFHNAVVAYNEMTTHDQYAGDGINGGSHGIRVDISVDPRRPVIHVEIDALQSGLFFRCEQNGDIVIQEVAL